MFVIFLFDQVSLVQFELEQVVSEVWLVGEQA